MRNLKFAFIIIFITAICVAHLPGEVGIKAGLNISKLSSITGDEMFSYKSRIGFQFGAFYTISLTQSLSVQPELYFIKKGGKVNLESDNLSFAYIMNYVEIPVLLRYKFPSQGSIYPLVLMGPYCAFKTSARIKDIDSGESVDITDNTKFIEFGFSGGLGAEYYLSESADLLFELRYNLGLSKVFKGAEGLNAFGKNNSLIFMVGASF